MQAKLETEQRACLCGSASCRPSHPALCTMQICQHTQMEASKYSKKIGGWVSACKENEVHRNIFFCGMWGGRGCGRGLVKAPLSILCILCVVWYFQNCGQRDRRLMILQYNQYIILDSHDSHDYLPHLIYLDYVLFDLSGSCRVWFQHTQHHIHPQMLILSMIIFLSLQNCHCV